VVSNAALAAAASIRATKDITAARALVANSLEALRLADDPDAQAQYIDHTLWLALNLTLEAGETVPEPTVQPIQPSVAAKPPRTTSSEEEDKAYVITFADAANAYLDNNPGPVSAPRYEQSDKWSILPDRGGLKALIVWSLVPF
jgi:hypothetical protein